MPPWVQKVTSRNVSTVRIDDDTWVRRRSYSRGGIHVGNAVSHNRFFDGEHRGYTEVLWPDGSLYKTIPDGEYKFGTDVVRDAVYEMADALRGVDTRPKRMVTSPA